MILASLYKRCEDTCPLPVEFLELVPDWLIVVFVVEIDHQPNMQGIIQEPFQQTQSRLADGDCVDIIRTQHIDEDFSVACAV